MLRSAIRVRPHIAHDLQGHVLNFAFNCRFLRSPCKHGCQQGAGFETNPLSLSAKPKPLHKRHQPLLQPVALGAVVDKAHVAAVLTHFQGYRRAQFFLAR